MIAAAAVLLALSLVALALGARMAPRSGHPRRALAFCVLLAALAVGLALGLLETSMPPAAGGSLPERVQHAAAERGRAGTAGLVLALPAALAAGLWGGIAAAWRTRRAGERARLSAIAAGHATAGQIAAAALQPSRGVSLGLTAGAVAALVCAAPVALALSRSGEALSDLALLLEGLDAHAATVATHLALTASARALREAAVLCGTGCVAVAGLAALLHIGSSRRRNLAVATRALQQAGEGKAAVATASSALSATGKPGPALPLLIAVVLLALAALAWSRATALFSSGPATAVAALSCPPAPGGPTLAGR